MNEFNTYYLKRSYAGDPFKSYTFLNEPEKILQKLSDSNNTFSLFLSANPSVDMRESLFNSYKETPEILTTIINEILSE